MNKKVCQGHPQPFQHLKVHKEKSLFYTNFHIEKDIMITEDG